MILHLVDGTEDDVVGAYRTIRARTGAYGHGLADKPEIVGLNKIDALAPDAVTREASRSCAAPPAVARGAAAVRRQRRRRDRRCWRRCSPCSPKSATGDSEAAELDALAQIS